MQFTLSTDFPVLPVPEAVSKTDKSITVRLNLQAIENPKQYKYQVAHSEHGYVYYSWTESELFTSSMCPVKGLGPNMTYVIKARVVDEESKQCGEWSGLSNYIRTFTEEEDAKRSGTVFEHALKLEREQKTILQSQISKLTKMLDDTSISKKNKENEHKNKAKLHEDMLSSRRIIDTTIHQLQDELFAQTQALEVIKQQRAADEQMITDLLNEQENLRGAHLDQADQANYEQEMQNLRLLLEKNEQNLHQRQEQVVNGQNQIQQYENSLAVKKKEIQQKEMEVEKLMNDCNRMVQEQADIAHAKQLELEEALFEAKQSLEQQLDINTYLREEVTRLREENHHLKNQIEEIDTKIVPKLIQLEDENLQLKQTLGRKH